MAKITSFNHTNIKALRKDINAALEAVLAKHGLTADLGNIRFGATDFRCKLNVEVASNTGLGSVADTTAANERKFKAHAWKFGLTGDEFGKTFKSRGTRFTIIEINPRAKKRGGYPVIAKNARGTEYKFAASFAKEAV